MIHTLFIKNMVCNRCKISILKLLNDEGFEVETIQLGKITVKESLNNDYQKLEIQLKELGFELIKDPVKAMVEKIKVNLIEQHNKKRYKCYSF